MKFSCTSFNSIIGDISSNTKSMIREIESARKNKVDVLVFPSLCLTTNCLGDLRKDELLAKQQSLALEQIKQKLQNGPALLIIFSIWDFTHQKEVILIMDHFLSMEYDGEFSYKGYFWNIKTQVDEFEFFSHLEAQPNTVHVWLNEEKYILGINEKRKKQCEVFHDLCKGTLIYCSDRIQNSSPFITSNYKFIGTPDGFFIDNSQTDENTLVLENDTTFSLYPYLPFGVPIQKSIKEIIDQQKFALINKLKAMQREKICIGVSGGLDSSVCLITCFLAFQSAGIDPKNIVAVTMPGFGTTDRTYKLAKDLMTELHVDQREIDLKPLLTLHLQNIGHESGKYDLTFEQTQSRERTQVLLDLANQEHAIMIGTGCMSEFALGWMTFGGDHLSMYAMNVGLPKTIVKEMARWYSRNCPSKLGEIIKEVVEGPVSPELLPIDANGEQHEKTEEIIGKYEILDFIIYYFVKNKSLRKIYDSAIKFFGESHKKEIQHCMDVFLERFFSRQYKKNCYGDGLHLLDYSMGAMDYQIPSDINDSVWKKEWLKIKNEENEDDEE